MLLSQFLLKRSTTTTTTTTTTNDDNNNNNDNKEIEQKPTTTTTTTTSPPQLVSPFINQIRLVKRAKISRLPRDELKHLTTKVIATLQVNGPQTLQAITDNINANKVHISRVLDVLLSTPLIAVSKSNSGSQVLYRYCHGKKLPTSVNMKTLRNDISYEMTALSETYELLIHLRSVAANLDEKNRASSSPLISTEAEKELLQCIERVKQLEESKNK